MLLKKRSIDEKKTELEKEIINPQKEGSGVASGSSSFRIEIEEEELSITEYIEKVMSVIRETNEKIKKGNEQESKLLKKISVSYSDSENESEENESENKEEIIVSSEDKGKNKGKEKEIIDPIFESISNISRNQQKEKESSFASSNGSSFRTAVEEEILSSDSPNYNSENELWSTEEGWKLLQKLHELDKINDKLWKWESLLWNSKRQLVKLENKKYFLQKIFERKWQLEKEIGSDKIQFKLLIKQLLSKINNGEERISEEESNSNFASKILAVKNQLETFQFSEITQEKIESESQKAVERIKPYVKKPIDKFISVVHGNIPGFSMLTNEVFLKLSQKHTKDQIKEIIPQTVKELTDLAISDLENNKAKLIRDLSELSEQVKDWESGLMNEIGKLVRELGEYRAKEEEIKKRAVEKIKQGKTLDSKAIVDLKQAKERINELEYEVIELEQNRNNWKDLYDGRQISLNSKEEELNSAVESLKVLNERLTSVKNELDIEKKNSRQWKRNLDRINEKKTKLEKENEQLLLPVREWRLKLLSDSFQLVSNILPASEQLQETTNTVIQSVSACELVRDLPNWTYEGKMMLLGIAIWNFMLISVKLAYLFFRFFSFL